MKTISINELSITVQGVIKYLKKKGYKATGYKRIKGGRDIDVNEVNFISGDGYRAYLYLHEPETDLKPIVLEQASITY